MKSNALFNKFFESEKMGGLLLVFCTIISLTITNSSFQSQYLGILNYTIAGNNLLHWINEGFMTIFFLLIGLELKREIYFGELSNLKKAGLPFFAALGGMIIPVCIFLVLNYNTNGISGAAIPMATDIAFAIGILSLLGNKIPTSLKIFLTALAVIDDLGAIIVIALFYTKTIVFFNLIVSVVIWIALLILKKLQIHLLSIYLIGGLFIWYFMLHSGIHPTISGIMLAFSIPIKDKATKSISDQLQHWLHKPVAFVILPLFALVNTAIILPSVWNESVNSTTIGILLGLLIGKPLGIFIFSYLAIYFKIGALPVNINWKHLLGVGILGGIGFTMSIFITLLAYNLPEQINSAKITILISSIISGMVGYVWLKKI